MSDDPRPSAGPPADRIEPLPGEPGIPNVAEAARPPWSKKGLVAVVLLVGSLIAVSAFSIQRFASSGKPADDAQPTRDRPAAATGQPRTLDMAVPAKAASAPTVPPRIPAIEPTVAEAAEPIGVRRTGQAAASPANGGTRPTLPEDAPVLLVSTRPEAPGRQQAAVAATPTGPDARAPDPADPLDQTRRNLEDYQRQLQGLLATLNASAAAATSQGEPTMAGDGASLVNPLAGGLPPPAGVPSAGGLFGGQMQGSATPRVVAAMLGNRSLTLSKGTAFTCALKTKVISATSGMVGCQVQRNVYSDDGRVLLIERGSHLDGEYRIASVRPGTVRIPVLWTRLRTPHGVTVDIESPGTGPLGESGVDGYVDNRWGERIGAAMLLSLIDDSVKLVIQNQANDRSADTIVLPSTTANTSKLAEKLLDSTIGIPPLIYQNQGGIVGIYVARDVDFSSVYELHPTARDTAR
ncbi:type IV secretion system protein VirB10 [Methylibium sp. Root1272]|uniref:type IV secretion system protein VirB10 n=1 Tax=Methylibium sp. Root1272 TaxID=1736441 RepID=UPI0006F787B6|nr:type IV secretion system protein VirB10 [Methylibium sp. Root1272]KQW69855.1 type IV secretion system protein VirB10 [Methylibium sp. Root1272]